MGFVLTFPKAVFELYQRATKKDCAYILNRTLRNVGYKAAIRTPKGDPAQIEAELRKDKIGLKFITKKLTGKKGSTYTTAKGRMRTIRRVTRKQIALRTRQFFARRKKRTGFMRQGWVAALAAAGLRSGGIGAGSFRGKSKLGSGRQATEGKLVARLGNAVYGRMKGKNRAQARIVMRRALEWATRDVSRDMRDYATERLAATAAKFSAKRGKR